MESPDEPAENLPKALKPYPKYITNLRQWNLRACHAALLFFGMMVRSQAASREQRIRGPLASSDARLRAH